MKKNFFIILLMPGVLLIAQENNSNLLNIENDDDLSTFSAMDSAVTGYNVFFTGEMHSYRVSNPKLSLKMLKYLYQQADVRIFLMECGMSTTFLLNKYLETGDTSLISVFRLFYTKKFLDNLKAFNDTLPEGKKIIAAGIDLEVDPRTAVRALKLLLPDSLPPNIIRDDIDCIYGLDGFIKNNPEKYYGEIQNEFYSYPTMGINHSYSGNYTIYGTLRELTVQYHSHKDIFEQYLGTNFSTFDKIMKGLEAEKIWAKFFQEGLYQGVVFREQYLYEQFLKVYKKHPEEKFFGQFGRCHTPFRMQEEWCKCYDFYSLAARINKSPQQRLKDKVLSTGVYYPKSYYEFADNTQEAFRYLSNNAAGKGLTLFDVSANSAVSKEFSDKFQYIIINKNQMTEEQVVPVDYAASDAFEYNPTGHFNGEFGYLLFDFASLDKQFDFTTGENFKEQLPFFGVGLAITTNNYYYSYNYSGIPESKTKVNDTTMFKMSGYRISVTAGGDLIKSPYVDIAPGMGVGISELKLTFENDNPVPEDGFEWANINKYTNPGFVLDFLLLAGLNLGSVGIGAKGGYQWDISNKKWRANTKIIDTSPETPLSAFYASGFISVIF